MGGEMSAPEAPCEDVKAMLRARARERVCAMAFTYCMYMNRVTKTVECIDTTNFAPCYYERFKSCIVEQTPLRFFKKLIELGQISEHVLQLRPNGDLVSTVTRCNGVEFTYKVKRADRYELQHLRQDVILLLCVQLGPPALLDEEVEPFLDELATYSDEMRTWRGYSGLSGMQMVKIHPRHGKAVYKQDGDSFTLKRRGKGR